MSFFQCRDLCDGMDRKDEQTVARLARQVKEDARPPIALL
jgi:hypothetical protein